MCQAHSERVWTLDEEEEIKDVFVRMLGEVYPWKDFLKDTEEFRGLVRCRMMLHTIDDISMFFSNSFC